MNVEFIRNSSRIIEFYNARINISSQKMDYNYEAVLLSVISNIKKNLDIFDLISLRLTNKHFNSSHDSLSMRLIFGLSEVIQKHFSGGMQCMENVHENSTELEVYTAEVIKLTLSIGDPGDIMKVLEYQWFIDPSVDNFKKLIKKSPSSAAKNLIINFMVENLPEITVLDLNKCGLSEFPSSVSKLQNLKELRLRKNRIMSVPECIGDLKQLSVLDISYNQIPKLPRSIQRLTNLSALVIEANHIKEFPRGRYNFPKLKVLRIGNNKMHFIPRFISNFNTLKLLSVSCNYLKKVPTWIEELPALNYLGARNIERLNAENRNWLINHARENNIKLSL